MSLPGLLASEALPNALPAARRRVWAARFLPESIVEHYATASRIISASLPAAHPRIREVPSEYIAVVPLDAGDRNEASHVTGSFGYVSSCYKAIHTEDGFAYALRRVDGVRAPTHLMDAVTAAWKAVTHPGIVRLRRIFSTSVAGPGVLFFVHDFHAGAVSLSTIAFAGGAPLPEQRLWSMIVQLVGALRATHDAGLSLRGFTLNHVLLTGHGRVRIAGAGVLDVLESDAKKSIAEWQQADMLALGHAVLSLASGMNSHTSPMEACVDAIASRYSEPLQRLVFHLLSAPTTAAIVSHLIAPQIAAELDAMYDHADALDELLAREYANGRAVRSLVKLGFVNERPVHDSDSAWAETGDRYLLKLFRDFLFHQVTDEGRAVLDVAHVADALNRLEEGTSDRIALSSRDGHTLLVASYAQLKAALQSAFDDLRSSAATSAAAAGPQAGVPPAVAAARRARGGYTRVSMRQPAMPLYGAPINAHSAAYSAAAMLAESVAAATAAGSASADAMGMMQAGSDGSSGMMGMPFYGNALSSGSDMDASNFYGGMPGMDAATAAAAFAMFGGGMPGVGSDGSMPEGGGSGGFSPAAMFHHMMNAGAHVGSGAEAETVGDTDAAACYDDSEAAEPRVDFNVSAPEFQPSWAAR